jgi:5-methylcytosine-specific restriction endonuclease McrA
MSKANPYSSAEYKKNRKIILENSQYTCHYCNAPANTADHIIPVSKGGGHELSNLLPACTKCNSSRQDRTLIRLGYWNKRYS